MSRVPTRRTRPPGGLVMATAPASTVAERRAAAGFGTPGTPTLAAAVVAADDSSSTTCAHCGRALPALVRVGGRPRRWCSARCRRRGAVRRSEGLPESWPARGPRGRASLARSAELDPGRGEVARRRLAGTERPDATASAWLEVRRSGGGADLRKLACRDRAARGAP